MLFSNELNYWVIKKNAKKYLLLRMGAPYQSPSQNLKKNISQRSGKFLKNVRVPTETIVLKVFSRRLRL
ncbi:hypothetical protein [Leptospira borgpetersenii]|uniref:Uncharacterized protein n=2 Tax=Leptospira borgpetersenii TaxID=174 RepID=A0A0S2IXR6_LEPBO|nr:hypothetical protein [Leptospira borgpetersenii]ALO28407.1 hypothetical protein LBBP_04293 [Leptospira borgpetersenii serovar Ballum]EKQ98189.1 hypothetical protein LEP1GSC121_0080 [Leptospira borgpetersenii serovar Castellonis str. 200801910]OOV43097.1 hypothetical protein B1H38_13125 [Leptospira borgpetersenii serovar Ballum]